MGSAGRCAPSESRTRNLPIHAPVRCCLPKSQDQEIPRFSRLQVGRRANEGAPRRGQREEDHRPIPGPALLAEGREHGPDAHGCRHRVHRGRAPHRARSEGAHTRLASSGAREAIPISMTPPSIQTLASPSTYPLSRTRTRSRCCTACARCSGAPPSAGSSAPARSTRALRASTRRR